MILFVVLSAMIFLGWSFVSENYLPQPPAAVATAAADGAPAPQPTLMQTWFGGAPKPAAPTAPGAVVQGSVPGVAAAGALQPIDVVLKVSPRVAIETPRLTGSINLRGGRIDDLLMTGYSQTIDKNSPPVRLFTPSGTAAAYFSQFGWTGADAPGPDTLWTASGTKLTPTSPVTLSWTNPKGVVFELRFAVDDNYMFTVTQGVTNPGTTPVTLRTYGLVSRTGEFIEKDSTNLHVGPLGVMDAAATVTGSTEAASRHAGLAAAIAGSARLAARIMNRLAAAGRRLLQADLDVQPNIRCLGDWLFRLIRRGFIGTGILIDDIRLIGRQQLLVSRTDFLETLGGLRIVAAIRMPAHGQPAVGALPVSRRRIVGYPESQERINVHSG